MCFIECTGGPQSVEIEAFLSPSTTNLHTFYISASALDTIQIYINGQLEKEFQEPDPGGDSLPNIACHADQTTFQYSFIANKLYYFELKYVHPRGEDPCISVEWSSSSMEKTHILPPHAHSFTPIRESPFSIYPKKDPH